MSFSGSGRFRFPGTADKRFNHTPLVVLFHISEMDHVLPLRTGGNHQERGGICGTIGAAMLACSQSLAAMLTGQLCEPLVKDKSEFALALEDSVIILAPLIPWSIAGAVPLASLGAPLASLPAACYLYLLPLWRLLRARKSNSDSVISPTSCG